MVLSLNQIKGMYPKLDNENDLLNLLDIENLITKVSNKYIKNLNSTKSKEGIYRINLKLLNSEKDKILSKYY